MPESLQIPAAGLGAEDGSAAYQELRRFFDEHSSATRLLSVAAHDYAAARCLLINRMFEGLVLGAQAIEKVLKSYLLLSDPQMPVRKLNHSLPKLLLKIAPLHPELALERFTALVAKFYRHYQTRYPDNPDASTSRTTADLRELDEIIVFLNEHLPCPRNVKYRTGFYYLTTFSLNSLNRALRPEEIWIKQDNHALIPLLTQINLNYFIVMKALHPDLGFVGAAKSAESPSSRRGL